MNQTKDIVSQCPVIVNSFDNVNIFIYTTDMTCTPYIEKCRVKLNISKADLARKLGIYPQAYYLKSKNDTWTVSQLKKIADIFSSSLVILFMREGRPLVEDFNGDISRYILDCEVKVFGRENLSEIARRMNVSRENIRFKMKKANVSNYDMDKFALIFDSSPVFYFVDSSGAVI